MESWLSIVDVSVHPFEERNYFSVEEVQISPFWGWVLKQWPCKGPIHSVRGSSFSKRICCLHLSRKSRCMVELCPIPIPSWLSNTDSPDGSSNVGDIRRCCRSTLQRTLSNQGNKLGPSAGWTVQERGWLMIGRRPISTHVSDWYLQIHLKLLFWDHIHGCSK